MSNILSLFSHTASGTKTAKKSRCEQKKFKAKIQYADKLSIPYVLFLGEDEIASGTASVKCLATGEQTSVSIAELPAFLAAGLAGQDQNTVILEK